jgi:hypothetical protein
MRTRTTCGLPDALESTRRRLERWRWTRDGRARIPEALWTAAVKVAGSCGLNKTARALGLDYYSLKKRLEAAGSVSQTDGQALASFIELPPAASGCAPECILELEAPRGAKMRIHLKGLQVPDLAALSQSFWSQQP